MKTKLLLLFTLLFFWKGEAQIIQFADADFKKVLLDANSDTYIAFDSNNQRITIDTNYDGEISIREASEVYSLDIRIKIFLVLKELITFQILLYSMLEQII